MSSKQENSAVDAFEETQTLFKAQDEIIELGVTITPDRLKLFIDSLILDSSQVSAITRARLLAILGADFVCPSLDTKALDEIVREAIEGKNVTQKCVAVGQAAVDGKDAVIRFLVPKIEAELRHGKPVESLKETKSGGPSFSGRSPEKEQKVIFDTSFVRELRNVKPEDVVAEVIPETKGKDGVDVFGQVIKSKDGKPLKVKFDTTIEERIISKKVSMVAKSRGFLSEEKGKLTIVEHLVIPGDVDMTTSNVDFIGAVSVKGNVVKGHEVTAQGTIEVDGSFYGKSLLSAESDIKVHGFISGSKRSRIAAAGSFYGDIVNLVNIEAAKDIYIQKEARDCVIQTPGALLMPEGHLFGSEVYCRKGVQACQLGSTGGSKTIISLLGESHIDVAFSELSEKITEHHQLLHKFKDRLGLIANYSLEQLEAEKNELDVLYTAALKYNVIKNSVIELETQLKELVNKKIEGVVFRVSFKELCCPGVEVIAVDKVFKTDSPIQGPKTIQFTGTSKNFRLVDFIELDQEQEKDSKSTSK